MKRPKRLNGLQSGLAVLVVLPMIAIGLLSAWFLEAERAALAAEHADRARQDAVAAATVADGAIKGSVVHLQNAIWQAYASGGATSVRSAALSDPLILLAAIYDRTGHRTFPAEQTMLFYFEQAMSDQYQMALSSTRTRLSAPADIAWSGTALEEGSGVISCLRTQDRNDVCLVLDADRLRALAAHRIQEAFSADAERFTIINTRENDQRLSNAGDVARSTPWIALAPPLSGWGVATNAVPAPTASGAWLAVILAPILTAVLAVAALIFWTQSQQAAQARRRIEILAQVSHDLRTPLANLKLYGSLLGQARALNPDIERYCEVIDLETDRLAALIDNALVCARDGCILRPRTDVANPDDTTRIIVERFSPVLKAAESVLLDLDANTTFQYNVAAYESILINLLDNARKYAHGTMVRVQTEVHDGFLVLTIEDDGVGLPGDVRCDPYSAFAGGSGRDGFGLGLAACSAQARAAGGDIQYTDAMPGARFVVRLPVREVTTAPGNTEAVSCKTGASECAS